MSDKNKPQIRFDAYLAARGLVASRHQATDLIRRRLVKLDGHICDRADKRLTVDGRYRIQLLAGKPYVSRGGDKLAPALDVFRLPVTGRLAFDIGASAGGFTDVLLRRGASLVVALDVGRQALSPLLAGRERILAFPQTDIRDFVWPDGLPLPDLIVADLSFISLRKVMAELAAFCRPESDVLLLVKPQFEGQPDELNAGIVKNQTRRREILSHFEAWLKGNGWRVLGKSDAAVKGMKGNLERFYWVRSVTAAQATAGKIFACS